MIAGIDVLANDVFRQMRGELRGLPVQIITGLEDFLAERVPGVQADVFGRLPGFLEDELLFPVDVLAGLLAELFDFVVHAGGLFLEGAEPLLRFEAEGLGGFELLADFVGAGFD